MKKKISFSSTSESFRIIRIILNVKIYFLLFISRNDPIFSLIQRNSYEPNYIACYVKKANNHQRDCLSIY